MVKIRTVPLTRRLFVMLCLVSGLIILSSAVVLAATIYEGPENTTYNAYWIGDERVKFKAQYVYTDDKQSLNAIVESTAYETGTHIWDDQWYYVTLPDNRQKLWLVSWYNIDQDEYGWLLIDNDPDAWWYKTNSSGWEQVGSNGAQVKRTWWSNGERIDIDVRNPENTGDWTPNDIWYSFGY